MAQEDQDRVLWDVIQAGWPGLEPRWPAFLKAGAVLWLPRALRRHHRLALPPEEPAAAATPAPRKAEAPVTAGPTGDGASGAEAGWQQPAGSSPAAVAGRPVDKTPDGERGRVGGHKPTTRGALPRSQRPRALPPPCCPHARTREREAPRLDRLAPGGCDLRRRRAWRRAALLTC